MDQQLMTELEHIALGAALAANKVILDVYDGSVDVELKEDGSPVTIADRKADKTIRDHLKNTGYPVVSEESNIPSFDTRSSWPYYWLVDPLDGTKEFINKNGEFTVNIALINSHKQPVLGIITAPVLRLAWTGSIYHPPIKMIAKNKAGSPGEDTLMTLIPDAKEEDGNAEATERKTVPLTVFTSRSHPDSQTLALHKKLAKQYGDLHIETLGSSLKFCYLAGQSSGLYPRFSPTCEWDTAAGHAILKSAGGEVINLHTREPLTYNKKDLRNPPFVAFAKSTNSDSFFSEFPF